MIAQQSCEFRFTILEHMVVIRLDKPLPKDGRYRKNSIWYSCGHLKTKGFAIVN